MCLKCEQLLDINKENKEKRFFLFNHDKVFKSIICDEEARKNKDFHLLERLISECLEKKEKVLNIIPSELSVQNIKMLQRVREEAYNNGIAKNTEQIVINMMKKNYSLEEISELTGLSIDNLKAIKQKKEC